jgi:hypothetical protein
MDAISKTELALDLRRIPMAAIKAGPAIQQRVNGTSEEVVAEYAQAMRAGDKFPPLDVFSKDDGTFHLADGFHRFEAHRRNQAGEQDIECSVHPGDRDDALLFACGANAGLRRSPSDQRKAVASLLNSKTWSLWSDREIARRCKVSPTLVARVRAEHLQTAFIDGGRKEERAECTPPAPGRAATETPVPDRRRTVMRGGKPYMMQTARIGGGRGVARSRKMAEPRSALDSLAWSTATPQERDRFIDMVGVADIETALKAAKPTYELMPGFAELRRAWQAASDPARKRVVEINQDEIEGILKAFGLMIATEPRAASMTASVSITNEEHEA